MIDQNKMRALAAHLRGPFGYCTDLSEEAADAIDLLLAEVEAAAARGALAQRQGEGS